MEGDEILFLPMEGQLHQEGKETEVNWEIVVVDLEAELIVAFDDIEHLKMLPRNKQKNTWPQEIN